jgi:hypothetical protein
MGGATSFALIMDRRVFSRLFHLAREPQAAFRDYAFAPGSSAFDDEAKKFFQNRSNTCLVRTDVGTVKSFIDYLKAATPSPTAGTRDCTPTESLTSPLSLPVGTFFIVSHANENGWFKISLDDQDLLSGANRSIYKAVADAQSAGTIHVPQTPLIDPRPTGSSLPVVRIVGCRLGNADDLIQQLRIALGNVVVIAPRHFDVFLQSEGLKGHLEYLSYSFDVETPDDGYGRNQIVNAFRNANPKFTYYYGDQVPDNIWDDWVPKKLRSRIGIDWAVRLNPNVEGIDCLFSRLSKRDKNQRGIANFRHDSKPIGPFGFDCTTLPAAPAATATKQSRREYVRTAIKCDGRYATVHRVYGKPTVDAFVDAFDWRPKQGTSISWFGHRHVYTCEIPVTNDKLELLYNYVGPGGQNSLFLLEQNVSDSRLFLKSAP